MRATVSEGLTIRVVPVRAWISLSPEFRIICERLEFSGNRSYFAMEHSIRNCFVVVRLSGDAAAFSSMFCDSSDQASSPIFKGEILHHSRSATSWRGYL